jgi:hypothetical protein
LVISVPGVAASWVPLPPALNGVAARKRQRNV